MSKPLLIYNPNYRSGAVYFAEHAKIMRLAFSIPETTEIMVQR